MDYIETPLGIMWMTDDGVLVHRIEHGLQITAEDARAVQAAVRELTGGKAVPAVVDIRSVGYADRDARKIFGASTNESFETATALIVGSSSGLTMAKAFLAMEPERPIEVFTSEHEAMEWAVAQLGSPDDTDG